MVDRLFQIIYLLMDRPKVTAKELAQRFEVSERTIYRDLDKLTLAGVPVYTNQGKNGGVSLLPDYVLDKSVLTIDEKRKLFEAMQAVSEVTSSKNKQELAKLSTFFGEQYQDWIEIAFSSWGNEEHDARQFDQIKQAILSHRYMEITYYGNRGEAIKRRIKPLKLCFKQQAWYLYAYCCIREDFRFFKLSRIADMRMLEDNFEQIEVGRVLTDAGNAYKVQEQSMAVTLEIKPEMAFRAFDELRDITVQENGSLRCAVQVTDIQWLISYILSFGAHAKVIEPSDLKQQVMQEIKRMHESYKTDRDIEREQ
ncbi:MAG: YafY family protein [Lachnospiraceae bacterium]|nr:YafY family protein [Lachnospiraceae bacterium]